MLNRKPLSIPKIIAERIPGFDSPKDTDPAKEMLWVRFIDPMKRSAWYVARFDGVDRCFGLQMVVNSAIMFDEFKLSDLSAITNDVKLGVQFDPDFKPKTGLEVLQQNSGHR